MKYPFYQRIASLNQLIYVGEVNVPDNRDRWLFHASNRPIRAFIEYSEVTADGPIRHELVYQKKRTIAGDMFVADVKQEIL